MVTKKVATKKTAPRKAIAKRAPPPPRVLEVIAPLAEIVSLPEKPKLVRDSFTMPKAEYELITELKGRLLLLSHAKKKSELLRAGIVLLSTLSDVELLQAMSRVPSLKTGRPKKTKATPKGARK